MDSMNRREILQIAASLAAAGLVGKPALGQATAEAGNTLRFFPGFTSAKVTTVPADVLAELRPFLKG